MIVWVILWAHRQRLSVGQTHKAPAAAVGCSRGPLRSRRRPEAVGQSPTAPLRRTRPTLTKITPPNRLPSQRLSVAPCLFATPKGVHAARRWAVSAAAPCARQLHPNSLPSFAPPSSTQFKMRPAHSAQRQNTSTLRRSGSFGFGRFVALQRSANGRRWPLRQQVPPYRVRPLTSHHPPVPEALRPPQHLSKRYAAIVGQHPQMRFGVRPPSVLRPQLPPAGRISAHGGASVGEGAIHKSPWRYLTKRSPSP